MDQKNGGQGSRGVSASDSASAAGATGAAGADFASTATSGADAAKMMAQQRETATEIARQRLLAAYRHTAAQNLAAASAQAAAKTDAEAASNNSGVTQGALGTTAATHAHNLPGSAFGAGSGQASVINQAANRVAQAGANPTAPSAGKTPEASPLADLNRHQAGVDAETWRRYHTAWQNYYQRYYGEYYSNAARNYVAKEKLKTYRAAEDERKLLEGTGLENVSEIPEKEIKSITGLHIRERFRRRVRRRALEQAKDNKRHRLLWPILAGVGVVLVFLFLQYNRLIFTPIIAYVSPGNADSSEITAVDPTVTTAVNETNTLIIPKINVDVPVHFGISNDDATVMEAMNNGVAHWSIPGASAFPGQIGNVVITGHSAGDIYSSNQYKFIFSGLERLEEGDTIYIDYEGTRYTYSVYELKVVEPTDVASLQYDGDEAILTLVTCTPLGTSEKRLLVFAKQISPSLGDDAETQAEVTSDSSDDTAMPSNSPTFFESIWNFLTGQS